MTTRVDYLVVGAGPAGLQVGYFLQRSGRDYLILESGETPGTFFRTFPRHRRLISINKPYTGSADPELNLRMDWNSLLSDDPALLFTKYSDRYFPDADDLVRYLSDFAGGHELRVRYDTRVMRIDRTEEFEVVDHRGRVYRAPRVVVATGPARPYLPAIPGIETAEPYGTVSVDPADFVNQRVLIIGKGNSAFENNNFLDTYQLKSQNALLDGNILNIERDDGGCLVTVSFARADEVTKDLRYDRVIVCTGFRFDDSIFTAGCRPELMIDDRFPALTSEWESTNVPDLYFAGTLMQVCDFKRSTSGFVPGFRYCIRALHRMLERKYHVAENLENDWTSPVAQHDPPRAFLDGRLHPVAVPATTAG